MIQQPILLRLELLWLLCEFVPSMLVITLHVGHEFDWWEVVLVANGAEHWGLFDGVVVEVIVDVVVNVIVVVNVQVIVVVIDAV